jgi:CspA family cold shock protein
MSITGTVKFFSPERGYGFIRPDDGSEDAFLHITALQAAGIQTLNQGDVVTYELAPSRDGRTKAVNLRLPAGDERHSLNAGRGDCISDGRRDPWHPSAVGRSAHCYSVSTISTR